MPLTTAKPVSSLPPLAGDLLMRGLDDVAARQGRKIADHRRLQVDSQPHRSMPQPHTTAGRSMSNDRAFTGGPPFGAPGATPC